MPNAPRIVTNLRRTTLETEEQYYELTVKWRTLSKVTQGSCCGPVFGTYNSFNLRYTNHTKIVAFADDLVIII